MKKPLPTPLAYRPGDAAHVLGVSRATIYEMIADGRLEARKIGTATLIAHTELERLFAAAELTDATKRARDGAKVIELSEVEPRRRARATG